MREIDIFISYKREEKHLAERLGAALNEAGYVVGTDADIEPNMDFVDAIQAMIDAAKATLVLWTAASAQSEWVKVEARRALKLQRAKDRTNIYRGVLLESANLPMDFDTVNMLDFSETGLTTEAIDAIVRELQANLTPSAIDAEDAHGKSVAFGEELHAFHIADQIDDASAMQGFLKEYPESILAALAEKRLRGHQQIWPRALRKTLSYGGLGVLLAALGVAATLWVGGLQQASEPLVDQKQLDELNARVTEAQVTIESLTSRNTYLEQQKDEQRDEITRLNAQEQNHRAALQAATDRQAELSSNTDALQAELDTIQRQLAATQQEKETQLAELEARVAFFEEALRLTQAARDRALSATEAQRQQISDLHSQSDDTEQQLASQESLIAQQQQHIAELQTASDRLRNSPQLSLASFSEEHRQILDELSVNEIFELVHAFGESTRYCSESNAFTLGHQGLADAGVIRIVEQPCGASPYSEVITETGLSLSRAIRSGVSASLGK